MKTRPRVTDETRAAIIEGFGAPAREIAARHNVSVSTVEAAWTAARRAGRLPPSLRAGRPTAAALERPDGAPPALVAECLASRGRESLSAVAKRLGLTRSQVAGHRHRAEAALARPAVKVIYDARMAELGPVQAEAEHDAKRVAEAGALSTPREQAAPGARPAVAADPDASPPADPVRKGAPAGPAHFKPPPSAAPPVEPQPIAPDVAKVLGPASDRDRDALSRLPSGMSATAVAVGLLRNDTCRWPLGDPAEPAFRFCHAPKPVERSYCPACANLAYSGRAPTFAPRAVVLGKPRRAA